MSLYEFKRSLATLAGLAGCFLLMGSFLSAHANNLTRAFDLNIHGQATSSLSSNLDSSLDAPSLAGPKASKSQPVDYSETAHADLFALYSFSEIYATSNPLSHRLAKAIPGVDVAPPLGFAAVTGSLTHAAASDLTTNSADSGEQNLSNLEQVSIVHSSQSAASRIEKHAEPADSTPEKQPQGSKTEPALVLMGGAMCFMGMVIGNLHKNSYRNI
jgi:hypothetical protein